MAKLFASLKALISGDEKPAAAPVFPCSLCKRQYATRELLRAHLADTHRCELCAELVPSTVVFAPNKELDDLVGVRRHSLKSVDEEAAAAATAAAASTSRKGEDAAGVAAVAVESVPLASANATNATNATTTSTTSSTSSATSTTTTSSSTCATPTSTSSTTSVTSTTTTTTNAANGSRNATTELHRCCMACATARRDMQADLRDAAQAAAQAASIASIAGMPRLDNVAGALDAFAVYETRSRIYIVGSTLDRRRYYVLKIERCGGAELPITEDKMRYTRAEKDELLEMIHRGNLAQGGLTKVCDAFGLLGFVRFLQGYYLVLITKRRPVAHIGRNRIYAIEEICNLYVPPQDAVVGADVDNATEKRYKDLFFGLDLTKGFYFSASYDLTHTIQHNMAATTRQTAPTQTTTSTTTTSTTTTTNAAEALLASRAQHFVWNMHLLKPIARLGLARWLLPIVSCFSKFIIVIILSRCCLKRSFWRRA